MYYNFKMQLHWSRPSSQRKMSLCSTHEEVIQVVFLVSSMGRHK